MGSAIVRQLQSSASTVIPDLIRDPRNAGQIRNDRSGDQIDIVTRTHAELDLSNQSAVQAFFAAEKPTQVYLAAAKVGGIHANNTYPADFIYQNLMVQANVIEAAFQNGVQKLLFLGSSCIYPKLAPQPMTESALLTGPLESTNEPYAIAKIAAEFVNDFETPGDFSLVRAAVAFC